jgi:general secretion pathway protein D
MIDFTTSTPHRGRRARPARALALGMALWLLTAGLPLNAAPKGDRFYKQGRQAELAQQFDLALENYERALAADPENQIYMIAARRMRFVAGQWHVDRGRRLLEQGQLFEAAAAFERATAIDPSSAIAQQGLRRALSLIAERQKKEKEQTGPDAAKPEPGSGASLTPSGGELSPLAAAREETIARLESAQSIPRLKPLSTQPINFRATNTSKIIFETVGKLAGINVLFDPDYQDRRFTLELNNATLYEALDYIAMLARAYWKPISTNAIFVTNDNTTKRRDYEDYVVRTFYLTNAYTAQELQEIATMVRSVTDIRRVFTINSLNALVIRATADQMALAEKVIEDVDKSRAEVIIDVLVLEASQTRTRELGITPVSGSTPGINIPIAFTPGGSTGGDNGTTTTAASNAIPLSRIGNVSSGDFSLTLPGATIRALMSRSDTRVLQSPRIRGVDGYKASLRIGDRIPIATGSFQPGIGGVGINPLVNTQFNYQDVGVVLDLTPKIHVGKEVSMHVEIEISNVRDRIDIGGISQPVIGQRKIIHDIRLEEGEGSIIGGLMQTQTTRSVAGVPGLADIPLLGRLFSNERVERAENEILLVLVPHVVRVPDLTDLNLRGISAGTDQTVRLNFAQEANSQPALPPPASTAPAATPAAPTPPGAPPAPVAPAPAAVPAPAATPPAAPPPAATPPAGAPAPAPAAPPVGVLPQPLTPGATPVPPAATLQFDRPKVTAPSGSKVTLNLVVQNAADLFSTGFQIQFDPAQVRLLDAVRGTLLSSDGQDVIFSKNIQNDTGQATINLSRFPGSGGVSGGGVLLRLELETVSAGTATVRVTGVEARNAGLAAIPAGDTQAEIVIQ